ncbi:MAG: amino acid ABC transporter permease [Verrucomicrobiota bacterium]
MSSGWRRWFWEPETPGESAGLPVRVANLLLVAVLAALLTWAAFARLDYTWDWGRYAEYAPMLWHGWLLTVGISLGALVLSLLLGVAVAMGRRSRVLALRYVCQGYIELIRGTPLLVQIIILWYVFFNAVGLPNDWRIPASMLILALYAAAYIAEIVRAGIEGVGRSQLESAKAIGLTSGQTFRHVVFPQALRATLPPLAGQLATLIKDSSLLSVIAVSEFTYASQNVVAMTYLSFEGYLPLAVGYLILTLPLSLWTQRLERQLRYDT